LSTKRSIKVMSNLLE